jgi:hypothetical protein
VNVHEDYFEWHSGLRFDRATRRFRPYVESNADARRQYATVEYDERTDAAVAASDLLDALREGREADVCDPATIGDADCTHERLR